MFLHTTVYSYYVNGIIFIKHKLFCFIALWQASHLELSVTCHCSSVTALIRELLHDLLYIYIVILRYDINHLNIIKPIHVVKYSVIQIQ